MANYIGKIAAVGTINMSQFASGLNASARDVEKYARSVRSTITSANTAAGRSFQEIFTPLQRLERALQASQNRTLRVDVGGGAERIRAIVGAAEDIARPLAASQKQFSTLAATVQNEFIGSLVRAQNAAKLAENAINRGQITNAAGYERLKRIVDSVTESQRRLSEASAATSGLATGRELRFQQADFASELQRASALQSQASALPADARRSGAVGQLVELQRREAEEAARLLSVLENVRNTRRGDAAAAQANLDAQVRLLGEVNGQLERQVRLSNEATRAFTLSQAPRQQRGLGLFGSQAGTEEEQALARARALSAEFSRLPEAAQSGLQGLAGIASRVSDAVQSGTSNATQLNAVLDRLSSGVQSAASAAGQQELGRRIGNGFLNVITVAEAQADTIEARQQELGRRIGNGFLTIVTAEEAAADTIEARQQELGRRIGNGFLNVITVAEAQADTIEARQQELGRRIGNGFLTIVTAEEAAADTIEARQQELGRRIGSGLLRVLSLAEAAADTPFAVDQRRRREAGSSLLQVIPLPRDEIRDRLGPDIASAAAEFSRLEAATVSVRSQIENLPAPIRGQFIPALRDAVEELVRLETTNAGADEIARATQRVNELRAGVTRADRAFQAFGGNFRDFADAADFQGAAARLQFLRQQILRASGDTTRAENAVENLASAFQRAANTPGGFRRLAAELNQVEREAIEATAAVRGISVGSLSSQISRVGDIGRGGFDRFTLGVNQAVFAIDDFFSVTGGIEQRLRASGNNLTQLGFILGNTTGLIIALAGVLAGQGLAAFIRFSNGGASAEQRTKLLNEALARQKSLVEELAEAFRSLGDTLANRVFSGPAQEARRLSREIDEIAKKQQELLRARAADLDGDVQRSRVRRRVLQDEFDNSNDPARRVFLQRQINQERLREQEAANAATERRVSGADVRSTVRDALQVFLAELVIGQRGEAAARQQRQNEIDIRNAVNAIPLGGSIEDIREQRRALEEAASRAPSGTGQRPFFGFAPLGREGPALLGIQQLITALETPLRRALDELSNQISRAAIAASVEIEAAQGDVADAIRRGVLGASDFQAALDNTARQLVEAQSQLAAAQEIDDVDRRETEVRRAEGRVRDVQNRIDAINERSRELRLGRTFGGDRATAALTALSGERFTSEEAGLRARLRASIDAEEQARRAVAAAIQREDEAARRRAAADLEAAQAASDLAAAAAEAAVSLEQSLSRIRQSAENITSQSERLANDAQQRLDEQDPIAPGAVSRDELVRDRDEAERQLIRDRLRERQLQNRLDRQRREASRDPAVAAIDQQIEQLRQEREAAAENARINGIVDDPAAAENRENRIAQLEASREQRVLDLLGSTRLLTDEENRLAAARRRALEEVQRQRGFEQELLRRQDPQGDALRGLDLLESPAQRAARDLQQNIADINLAFDSTVEAILARVSGRPQNAREQLEAARRERDDAVDRARGDAIRAQAPLLARFSDEVFNALLQGPSRAALQATDASTLEGQRELNRLLRGDDPARDVNLLELQRQTAELEKLVELAQNGPQVAN